jgi:hypothetical protein
MDLCNRHPGQRGARAAGQFHSLKAAQYFVGFFELTHMGNDGTDPSLRHPED